MQLEPKLGKSLQTFPYVDCILGMLANSQKNVNLVTLLNLENIILEKTYLVITH